MIDYMHSLIQQKGITVYAGDETSIDAFIILLQNTFTIEEHSDIYFVSPDWPNLPFLSLKDQLFLGLTRKQYETEIPNILDFLQLPTSIVKQAISKLSALDKFKLQLARGILLNKKKFFLENSIDQLTILEIQEILPLLQKLANHCRIDFTLITSDPNIVKSSYVSTIYQL